MQMGFATAKQWLSTARWLTHQTFAQGFGWLQVWVDGFPFHRHGPHIIKTTHCFLFISVKLGLPGSSALERCLSVSYTHLTLPTKLEV